MSKSLNNKNNFTISNNYKTIRVLGTNYYGANKLIK